MGILDEQNTVIVPPSSIAANALVSEARDVWTRISSSFTEGAKYFWANPQGLPPQDIADALGSAAQEVFSLHALIGQLMEQVKPGSTAAGMEVVGTVEYGEGGVVTVTPKPLPEPEPVPEPPAP
jgi:hypothetical protein